MYERLLDKQIMPSFDDLIAYCGQRGVLWRDLDRWIKEVYSAQTLIRFPYGNKYGWSCKYSFKNKHICDVFAEKSALAVQFHISNKCIDGIYESLLEHTKEICDNKYPCGEGGWLTYRVLSEEQADDVKKLLASKFNVQF